MSYKREAIQKQLRHPKYQALIAEQERLFKKAFLVLAGYFVFILLLSYLLPEDALVRYQALAAIVTVAESWIPSIENFGEVSAFPQVAQLVFTLEVITLPIWLLFLIKITVTSWNVTVLQWLAGLLVVLMLMHGYFIYIPGDGHGYNFAHRILRSMTNSKFYFAMGTSLYTFCLALFIALMWTLLLGKNKIHIK
jgi:hypothetical protein